MLAKFVVKKGASGECWLSAAGAFVPRIEADLGLVAQVADRSQEGAWHG